MCLTTDAILTAVTGPARSHTFVEIDHEIISMVILFPSANCLVSLHCVLEQDSLILAKCTKYWLTACSSLPRKKVWLGELAVPT